MSAATATTRRMIPRKLVRQNRATVVALADRTG
jgi:hypothetical protein